jgi:chaperonin GroES
MSDQDTHAVQDHASASIPKLTPRLFNGLQAEYVQIDWPGSNTSGLRSFGTNVLVKVDQCAGVRASGLIITDEATDLMTAAAVTGCIFAIGPRAFPNAIGDDRPKPGDRIYFDKFAGIRAKGLDGGDFRIMDDTCIAAGLLPEVTEG